MRPGSYMQVRHRPENGVLETRPSGMVGHAATERRAWVGASVPRKEDPALMTGEGRFIDDLSPFPNLRHAAILRSPYAHARIVAIDSSAAIQLPGVVWVLTGADVVKYMKPFAVGIETSVPFYPCAVDKVRYVG